MRKVINGMKKPRCKSTLKEGDKIVFVNGIDKGLTGIAKLVKRWHLGKDGIFVWCLLSNGEVWLKENTLDWEFA